MKPEDLQRKNIYKVPENYFDRLPGKIMARVTEAPVEQHFIFSLFKNIYWKSAFAGATLVLAFIFIFFINQQPAVESHELMASISEQEAMEYLLRSEKIDSHDLSILSQADKDLSHEFLQASQEDIIAEVEHLDLEQVY